MYEQIYVRAWYYKLMMRSFIRKCLLSFLAIILILSVSQEIMAEEGLNSANSLITPQNISFEQCTKIFGINQEKLFNLTLAALSANRFNINEIQTANGYVIFSTGKNKYLATIAKIDGANSILKITPCNNIYNFPLGILTNTYKYIELNLKSL